MKKEPDKLLSRIFSDIILILLLGFAVFGCLLLLMQFI
jgi:hypothetical protein